MSFYSKLREGTIIRMLVFFSYKLITFLLIAILLPIFNSLVERIVGFSFRISILKLFWFFVFSCAIDFCEILSFSRYILNNFQIMMSAINYGKSILELSLMQEIILYTYLLGLY